MLHRKKQLPIPKDTLIIIGNGFDIWQGLDTGYDKFQKFYLAHRDEIMRKLHIRKHVFRDEDGRETAISDVELIYGNPFEPQLLDNEFWSTFEASLDKLDSEQLNMFFGKDNKGLREMNKSIRNASQILREAFCSWIATIVIDEKDAGYRFGDNCLFINFNYTDTLQKRFQVKDRNVYHIHGEASDKDSIIYGHSSHPQMPEDMLYRLGGRFRGLYFIDRILYETDKHVAENIQSLCMFLALHAAMSEEIKDVYVLGHSFGLPDLEYFTFLAEATKVHDEDESERRDEFENEGAAEDLDSMDELHNRLQYTINRVGYHIGEDAIDDEQRRAMDRRYAQERMAESQEFQRLFYKMISKDGKKLAEEAPPQIPPRTEDAAWHISYHSDRDKQWMEALMKELGCQNVTLYPTIDECLKPFKTS